MMGDRAVVAGPNCEDLNTNNIENCARSPRAHWGHSTSLCTSTNGADACNQQPASDGKPFSMGNGNVVIVAAGNSNGLEVRISCGGSHRLSRTIAIYCKK